MSFTTNQTQNTPSQSEIKHTSNLNNSLGHDIMTILERIERKIDDIDERLRRSEQKQIQLDTGMTECKSVVTSTKQILHNTIPLPQITQLQPIVESQPVTQSSTQIQLQPTVTQMPESTQKFRIRTAEKRLKLPCKTIEELEFVENEIRENIGAYNCLVRCSDFIFLIYKFIYFFIKFQYLQRFRVNDHSKFIRRSLHHVFDDSLASSFNWSGKGEKHRRAASELQIIRVIKGNICYAYCIVSHF